MRNTMPCVGLVVLVGSLTFVITPDEEPSKPKHYTASGKDALPLIVIDPGHGGKDGGARSNGLVEKELTLDLAQRVDKRLQRLGGVGAAQEDRAAPRQDVQRPSISKARGQPEVEEDPRAGRHNVPKSDVIGLKPPQYHIMAQ